MSILSWNCQGAGNTETIQRLRELRRKYFPDLLFLMETKQKSAYIIGLKDILGYDKVFTVEPVGLSGRLALFWKTSLDVDILSANKRIIDLKVKIGSLSFYVSCMYGDPIRARRNFVWNQLSTIGASRDDAWVLVGDFNELMEGSKKLGGPERHTSTFWDFRNMATNCKIKEMRSKGNSLSWAGLRDQMWIQCRLDRSFGNDEWFNLFPRSETEYLCMRISDHRPLRISFSYEACEENRGRFYFDKRMLGKAGIEEAVMRGWSCGGKDARATLADIIIHCCKELAKWKRASNLNSRNVIEKLQLALEKEISKRYPNFGIMKQLKYELATAHKAEERFWRQRSIQLWLKSGDKNTQYFHNSMKGRKNLNRILMLLDDFGQEHFSEGAKGHIAAEYFRNLFLSANPFDLETIFEGFLSRITPEMNEALIREVSEDEIKRAAFGVKGSSAPGEDGFSGTFYQKFWHIVGPSVTHDVRCFFSSSTSLASWNHTQLCLIPKITNPTNMKDMRPISLCSVQYKIVSKILCERLKVILPQIVSETQGAFVAGRSITDNIIIAHEMIHGLRTNDYISDEFMAVKTDMSKAFDIVEWSFLETLREKMGFDRRWISWIMSCISSVSYSVLLNGRSHGFIRPERGIRQGDPLSSFLLILCDESLVHSVNMAEASGRLHGIRLSSNGLAVHHLLFADDNLLMCRASAE
ncbi:hypothetical protein Bca101_033747 [Brassica carinata]